MQERARLARIGRRRELEQIEELLPRDARGVDRIVIGHDGHQGAVGDVARRYRGTEAAAVDEAYVRTIDGAEGVRDEVTEIRLSIADTAQPGHRIGIT